MLRFICIGVLILNSLWAAALGGAATGGAAAGGAAIGGGGAAAGALIAQTEEGWRWRNNLVVQLGGREIDLREEHQRLADLIQQVHIRLAGDWENKNLLAFSFTLITQTAGGDIEIHPITTRHPKGMGAASRPVLFQSGKDSLNPADAFWAGIAPHWFFARKDVAGNDPRPFRNYLLESFTENANHIDADCQVHACCEGMAAEQLLENEHWGDANPLEDKTLNRWHSDYAHTEQFLLKFLSDEKVDIKNQVLRFIPGISEDLTTLPAGTIIKALILNVHTRLDMCNRCAPSLYRAMIDTSPVNFSQYIKDQLQQRNPAIGGAKEMPIFKILVSSSMPLQNGLRRKNAGIDDQIADIIPLIPNRPLTQTPITLTPMRRPNVPPLPQSY